MSFKTDLAADIATTIYDLDDFADSATFTPKSTGIASASFAAFIGDNVMHGNSYTEDVEEELIEMSTPTSNITGIKEFDTITANSINYEVAGPAVLDSPTSNIAFVMLRRSLNNQTRM